MVKQANKKAAFERLSKGIVTCTNVTHRAGASTLTYMVKIVGEFSTIKVRSEYKQEKPYRELDVVLAFGPIL